MGAAFRSLLLAGVIAALPSMVQAQPAYQIETVAEGLDHPWGLAFLPDGSMLVTERPGRVRVIRDGDLVPEPVRNVPAVLDGGQGGLFDVVLHPAFETNSLAYLTYAHGTPEANGTRLARGRFTGDSLEDLEVLYTATPLKDTRVHYGGRMVFLQDGTLLLTLGDGFDYREEAQNLASDTGSILRLNDDGTIPDDNPFVGRADARDSIWSFGHRNVQGIVLDPLSGRVYAHEHGPRGGDELNLIEPGLNYGWPIITHGVDYSGALISPFKERSGLEQPLKFWVPSIAPAGMTLYSGSLFRNWDGDLFIAALVPGDVRRIDMEAGKVVGEEILFNDLRTRIRDVRTGPDGALYLLTDEVDGKVLRVTPG